MMKVSKTFFAVLLIVFCLAIMVFSAVPSGSTVGEYDPQLDINHDGVINVKDIALVARAFGSSGDPTENVIVTSANWTENTYSNTIDVGSDWIFQTNTAGFRKVIVSFYATCNPPLQLKYGIEIGFMLGNNVSSYLVDTLFDTAMDSSIRVPMPSGFVNCTTESFDVTGSQIWIWMHNPNPGPPNPEAPITVYLSIFMTA